MNSLQLADFFLLAAGGRFEVDERSGVVRTRGSESFQLDMEYVLYVKAEDQNGKNGRWGQLLEIYLFAFLYLYFRALEVVLVL